MSCGAAAEHARRDGPRGNLVRAQTHPSEPNLIPHVSLHVMHTSREGESSGKKSAGIAEAEAEAMGRWRDADDGDAGDTMDVDRCVKRSGPVPSCSHFRC